MIERLFKGHKIQVVWDEDINAFVIKCYNLSTSEMLFCYTDFDLGHKKEVMFRAKTKLNRMLKSEKIQTDKNQSL